MDLVIIFGYYMVIIIVVMQLTDQQNETTEMMGNDSVLRNPSKKKKYIIEGSEASIIEFPYLVSIQILKNRAYYIHHCGGTLLNSNWVLTACQCVKVLKTCHLIPKGAFRAVSGSTSWNEIKFADRSSIETIFPHIYFNCTSLENDISLLKLTNGIGTQFIKLPEYRQFYYWNLKYIFKEDCITAGWGPLKTDLRTKNLHKVNLSLTQCNYPNVACTFRYGVSTCIRDLGGPLICGQFQVGIYSWAIPDCETGVLGWTRVDRHEDWIKDTMETAGSNACVIFQYFVISNLVGIEYTHKFFTGVF